MVELILIGKISQMRKYFQGNLVSMVKIKIYRPITESTWLPTLFYKVTIVNNLETKSVHIP